MMPGMNGYEVAEKLKADPQTQEIPIIFLTALNSTNDIVKGFKTGASDYISKPFNKEELLIRVTHQISLIAAKRLIASQMKELQSTIRGRDRLYSVIAHDLRSPMGSLKMIFNLLMAQLPPEKIGPEIYDMLSMANHTAEETFSLLDNLLKWTKSQNGRLKTVYQEIDMMEVIGMSSRVIVMYEGRISGTLQKEELSEELIMQFGMGMKKERTKEETEG